jgi:hypothetical protein
MMVATPRSSSASDHQCSSSFTAFVPWKITTTGAGRLPGGTRR